jgi:hypothetical protein
MVDTRISKSVSSETFIPGEWDRQASESASIDPPRRKVLPLASVRARPRRRGLLCRCPSFSGSPHGPPQVARWTNALAIVWGIVCVLRPFTALVGSSRVIIGIGYASDLLFPSLIRVVSGSAGGSPCSLSRPSASPVLALWFW